MSDNASNSPTNVYCIDPLKGAENYSIWKIKMTDILMDLSFYEIVTGTNTRPTDNKLEAWLKQDQLALSMIRLRVADKMLVYVASAKTSAEAWTALKMMLEPQGSLGIVLVRRKLFRAFMEEGTNIEEHIWMMQGFKEELISLGQEISDTEFSITMLTSLPELWNNFISGLDTIALNNSARVVTHILELD